MEQSDAKTEKRVGEKRASPEINRYINDNSANPGTLGLAAHTAHSVTGGTPLTSDH